jgi:transposase
MRIFEYKAYANAEQYAAIDEAIRTTQFVRNKCIRLWMDAKDTPYSVGKSEISGTPPSYVPTTRGPRN